ncbi:MAG: signal peptide peptidase SppA [Deltaproteobacteria bacterium]|nr:signal peptide peptidase SppA [Deltaproteobacteria bacterium]
MFAVALLSLAVSQPVVLPIANKPPLEAHATLDGQDALQANAGTLAFQEGAGFSYRHVGPPREGDTDAFLAAWAPWSFVTFGGGLEYARFPGDHRFLQGAIALGFRPTVALSVSLVYRPFFGMGALQGARLDAWDFGLGFRPARWLSLTAAIENFSNPVSRGFVIPRTYAVGFGVRPFRSDFLTIGADARLRETLDLRQWPAPRFTLDVRPVSWLGLMLSATTKGEFYAGVTVREQHVDAGVGFGVSRDQGFYSSYVFARGTTKAREGLDFTGKKTVQMALKGELRPGADLDLLRIAMGDFTGPPFGEIPLELYALAERADITGVRLVFQGFDCNFATLHEIRDAILHLRKKGKRVVAELGESDDRDLYVASAADEIIMEPEAGLAFDGIKVTIRNYKGLLDKIGVKVEAHASGEYKNSPDSFTKEQPSSQQIMVQNALLDDMSGAIVKAVADGRKLPEERVRELIEKGLFSATQAKDAGLIDTLAYNPDPAAPLPRARYSNLVNAGSTVIHRDEWNEPPEIAIVSINGTIAGGDSFEDPFGLFPIAGAGTIIRAIEKARLDPNVEAIVVRINSPGGDILASDFIWQAMRRAALTKPTVVSMGDMAASGGYYSALPAHVIFAEPETVTGSIGVFNFSVDLSGLFAKLGINNTVIKRGEHADMTDLSRPLTDEEHTMMHAYVGDLYQSFLRKVAHARKLDVAKADSLARGRVWSGKAAFEHGLVDKLGGLIDAINEAKRLAGLSEAAIVNVRPYPAGGGGRLERFAAEVTESVGIKATPAIDLKAIADYVRRVSALFSAKALYLSPEAF